MKFNITRDNLLECLQAVSGAVDRRQNIPVLGNVLVRVEGSRVEFKATDMEVELVAYCECSDMADGVTTLPSRKLLDIARSLNSGESVLFESHDGKMNVRCGRSRFSVGTLPAEDFPASGDLTGESDIVLPELAFKGLIELTQFAMAQQDVRYYLNGMLLDLKGEVLRAITTDGHRLALGEVPVEATLAGEQSQWIVPRKGILELTRLLTGGEQGLRIALSGNAVRVEVGNVRFTSKLIDGNFPDYERVVPVEAQCDKKVLADRESLRQALSRVAILSNEKYRAVRLMLEPGGIRLSANNPESEEAEDVVAVEYDGPNLEIGFNVSYLIEALGNLPGDSAELLLADSGSSCLIKAVGRDDCRFVVMPMRL